MNRKKNMEKWNIEKGSGIFNNKRIPDACKLIDNIHNLKKLLDELTLQKTKKQQDLKEQISYKIIRTMRNYQALLYTWKIDSNRILEISPYICELLDLAAKKMNFEQDFTDFSKKLCGDISSFTKLLRSSKEVTSSDINRRLNTIIKGNGGINKYASYFKEKTPTYTHSFLSDASRISFSSSFRRLQDKAQVFPLEKHDYARTRLTHSIEVKTIASQLGNLCGQGLCPNDNAKKKEFAFLTEKILICSALLHDMGNPPFGHFGEDAIRNFFKEDNWEQLKYQAYSEDTIRKEYPITVVSGNDKYNQMKNDFLNFDGNAQSLRVAAKGQNLKMGESLDLTAAVLGSIIKYPCNSTEGAAKQKFGYFYSENDLIATLECMEVFKPYYRNPMAMLLEAADDISYVTSDLIDAVKKQALSYQEFDKELTSIPQNASKQLKDFAKNFRTYYKNNLDDNVPEPFEYTVSRMATELRENLIREVVLVATEEQCLKKIFQNGIYYKCEKEFANHLLKNSNGLSNELLEISAYYELVKWIKNKLFIKHIYKNREIIQNELIGHKVITGLLHEFVGAVLSLDFRTDSNGNFKNLNSAKLFKKEEKIFNMISKNFIEQFKSETKNLDVNSFEHIYYRLRLVVDYISGMTDGYAVEIYQILQ